jgi:hypothetical protein
METLCTYQIWYRIHQRDLLEVRYQGTVKMHKYSRINLSIFAGIKANQAVPF